MECDQAFKFALDFGSVTCHFNKDAGHQREAAVRQPRCEPISVTALVLEDIQWIVRERQPLLYIWRRHEKKKVAWLAV